MLDNITKKNIDNCRDVLVGKVPDPKSQIEQITLALIYKFMDDMDKESMELGGKPKFFTGEYEKFSWRKLLVPSLSGKEMLDLYSDALDTLQTNANLPELFRNIFKNAYLPYRDPATLKMFLKYIDEFEYSHSEKLGDAFEYLLSVMGSQGDAGQFRTPRHIIDFIAACLNPQKNESVADPACGTSGFLLSAYKHILSQNTVRHSGDKLTPDDRKKLAENFVGYDISPDMVRLSLVNMYLHGFATPKIFEYDTLSSEDRWNETFDVILANPPFMTPKGGIRPHKKFGVQANKAEVLFTDYIAEHLNKNGRAGIVVPNGIVATTQTAYKQLRKLLVEDSLIAVISLPAGCFNPYSGVKTSILMLDKSLAKKSDHVLFIKINNDGYDLGAQRREIDKNDLPLALEAFNQFKKHISEGKIFDTTVYNDLCLLVEKEKILSNKDIVLSGDRFKESDNNKGVNFLTSKLSEVATLEYGYTEIALDSGDVRFIRITDISESGRLKSEGKKYIHLTKESEKYLLKKDDVLMARTGATYGKTMIYEENYPSVFASFLIRINLNKELILPKFYWCFSQTEFYWEQARNLVSGGGQPQFNGNALKEIEIPLPPLEIQEQIVKEIEGYQKIIDGAKMVVENYKPTISIKPEWEMVELGDICDFVSGYAFGSRGRATAADRGTCSTG
jgi:type I restriction enzyme M protein